MLKTKFASDKSEMSDIYLNFSVGDRDVDEIVILVIVLRCW